MEIIRQLCVCWKRKTLRVDAEFLHFANIVKKNMNFMVLNHRWIGRMVDKKYLVIIWVSGRNAQFFSDKKQQQHRLRSVKMAVKNVKQTVSNFAIEISPKHIN